MHYYNNYYILSITYLVIITGLVTFFEKCYTCIQFCILIDFVILLLPGSENNSLYLYYKGLSKTLLTFKFDTVKSVLDKDKKEDDTNEFVSAVCWRALPDGVRFLGPSLFLRTFSQNG